MYTTLNCDKCDCRLIIPLSEYYTVVVSNANNETVSSIVLCQRCILEEINLSEHCIE